MSKLILPYAKPPPPTDDETKTIIEQVLDSHLKKLMSHFPPNTEYVFAIFSPEGEVGATSGSTQGLGAVIANLQKVRKHALRKQAKKQTVLT